MGMESFFVMLLPKGINMIKDKDRIIKYIGKSNLRTNNIISIIKKNYKISEESNLYIKSYVLEEFINIKFNEEGEELKDISLEICFFHFEEGLKKIYEIGKLLENKCGVRLFHPGLGLLNDPSFKEFENRIKEFYGNKYANFKKQFGELKENKKVLPNKDFVDYLENKG